MSIVRQPVAAQRRTVEAIGAGAVDAEVALSRAPSSPWKTSYAASLFGPFKITRDGQSLGAATWRRNRARTLLKWFLINPGKAFTEADLCMLLWSDRGHDKATNNLHVTLHYLRHMLEPGLPPRSPSTFVRRAAKRSYLFDPGGFWWTDAIEVESLRATARATERNGGALEAIALYEQLVDYYRLGFLPEDLYDDAFATHRHAHEVAHTDVMRRLMHLYLRVDRLSDALSCAIWVLSVDPYQEEAAKAIVYAHLRQGDFSAAIRQLNEFLDAVKRHIGLSPDHELIALRKSILLAR